MECKRNNRLCKIIGIVIFLIAIILTVACLNRDEKVEFPRGKDGYPSMNRVQINAVNTWLPHLESVYKGGAEIAYGAIELEKTQKMEIGVIEIEQTDTFEIYLPQDAGICSWKLLDQDGVKAHESWLNLRTEEDKFLDGQSWALQKYEIEIEEVKELHFVWYNEYKGQEYYSLTIRLK